MQSAQNIILERILSAAMGQKASDLHFTVGSQPAVRIDGQLRLLYEEEIIQEEFVQGLVQSFLTPEQQAVFSEQQEVVVSYTFSNHARAKIHVLMQQNFPSIIVQFIASQPPQLATLGLPESVQKISSATKGLILLGGPYGSGKSTTAAALIETINHARSAYIITLERPVEHIFNDQKSIIDQRAIGKDTPSFTQGLEHVHEEDVDVLFVSDLRDPREIELVLEIAQGNTLVIAIMHASTSLGVLEKILQSFPSDAQGRIRSLLAEVLIAVVTQQLVMRIGGGRMVVAEVLLGSSAVRSILKEGRVQQLANILQTSREEGMITLERALADLVQSNQISRETAFAHTHDEAVLQSLLKRS